MALAVFLAVTAVAMLGPLLVDMAGALGVTVPVAGQLATAAAATWAVTALVAGPLSDAYGRKPVLLFGLCLLAAGALGMGLAPTFAAAAGAAIGGAPAAHFGYGALSFLLAGAVLASGLLMAFAVTESAVARARTRLSSR